MIRLTGGRPWFLTGRAFASLWIPIALVTAAHYLTGERLHWLHDIWRRLYYLPIILGAFSFGLRGSTWAAVVVAIVYIPHAFLMAPGVEPMPGHAEHAAHMAASLPMDPADGIEKALEIVLYLVVGLVTGALADREKRERARAEDIAENLRAAMDQARLLEQEVIRAERLSALGELTAGLAHEIRNPLGALKGTAQILEDEIPVMSPRRRMLELHVQALDRLESILDRFLSFARPQPLELADVAILGVLEDVQVLMAAHARGANVDVIVREGPDVPVRGDREKLQQVVLNLVLNAVHAVAMPEGEAGPPGRGHVELAVSRTNRAGRAFAAVEVVDDGPGVPLELREKIFNPFFTTKPDGTGLGLSITARIVEEHAGIIEVDDAPSGGARFRVLLPLPQQGA